MATPVGHGLAGLAVAVGGDPSRWQDRAWLGVGVGLAPDLDFLPGLLLGDPARFHHGITHTLCATLFVGGLVFLLASRGQRWSLAAVAALAHLSHLVLDLVTHDPSVPRGLPLLWPLWDEPLRSPVILLPRVIHTAASPLNMHNLGVAAMEATVLGSLVWLLLSYRRRKWRSGHE